MMDGIYEKEGINIVKKFLNSSSFGYITIPWCILGIITNIWTLLVLSHRSMKTSANLFLYTIAIADLLTMAFFTPRIAVRTIAPELETSQKFCLFKVVSKTNVLYESLCINK